MPVRNYRDLIVWKKAVDLALAVYQETACFPDEERFGLRSQMRRAAVSVPSNIAEGEGRRSRAEFRHFASIAHGSIREIETQVTIASLLGYLNKRAGERLEKQASEVGRLLNGLARSLLDNGQI